MSFSFPSSPSVGQTSVQNGRTYEWSGYTWDLVKNIATHASNHASSGTDPISISSSQITDFNSSVSGLLPSPEIVEVVAESGLPAIGSTGVVYLASDSSKFYNWIDSTNKYVEIGPSTFYVQSHTHASTDISDSTTTGRSLLTAATASAARTTLDVQPTDNPSYTGAVITTNYATLTNYVGRRANGTSSSPTAIANGQIITAFTAQSYDGSSYAGAGNIQFVSTQAHTASARGTDMRFFTTATDAATATERMRITDAGVLSLTSGQLQFPATANLSADANTLDDYEEGTFTPTFTGGTTNPTVTYTSARYGVYVKVGRTVFFQCRLTLSAASGGSGILLVSGLPFAGHSLGPQGVSIGVRGLFTTQGPTNGYIPTSTTTIYLTYLSATSSTSNTTANLAATSDITLHGTYHTDA